MKTATRSLWINLVLLLLAFTARAQTTTAISTLATATNAAGGDRILLNQASGSSYTTKQIAVSNLSSTLPTATKDTAGPMTPQHYLNNEAYDGHRKFFNSVPFAGVISWYTSGTNSASESWMSNQMYVAESSGWLAAGMNMILLDDGWQGGRTNGVLAEYAPRWPSGLSNMIHNAHSRGFKVGLYIEPAVITSALQTGSLGYLTNDAALFARWGVDLVKFDVFASTNREYHVAELSAALDRYGFKGHLHVGLGAYDYQPWVSRYAESWRCSVGGHVDVTAAGSYGARRDILRNFDQMNRQPESSGPGRSAQLDSVPMWIGETDPEALRTDAAMFAIIGGPILMHSYRPTGEANFASTYSTLSNAWAIIRDGAGFQGCLVQSSNVPAIPNPATPSGTNANFGTNIGWQVWMRPLASASGPYKAILVLNRDTNATATISLNWTNLGFAHGENVTFTDVLHGTNYAGSNLSLTVPTFTGLLFKAIPTALLTTNSSGGISAIPSPLLVTNTTAATGGGGSLLFSFTNSAHGSRLAGGSVLNGAWSGVMFSSPQASGSGGIEYQWCNLAGGTNETVINIPQYSDSSGRLTFRDAGDTILATLNKSGVLYANGSGITNLTGTFLAATNAAAANSYGTALWIGTNNAGIGTPWLLVSNHVTTLAGLSVLDTNNEVVMYVSGNWQSNNLVVGSGQTAATNFTTGSENVGMGAHTLEHVTTGIRNTAVGASALAYYNGNNNTAIGGRAMYQHGGDNNTAVGYSTINGGGSGGFNTAIGHGALGGVTTGQFNNSMGYRSLSGTTLGSANVALGIQTLAFSTNSSGNVAIGQNAGGGNAASITDNAASLIDTNCTFIGTSSGRTASIPNTTPLTNAIALGYNAKALANNTCTIGGTGKEAVALILNPMASQPTNIVVGNPYIYSRTNSSVAELFAVGGDGVETQISPHADDAPPQLYDRTSGDMKEIIWRESNPFITNGLVSFINLRRMARTMELHTRVLLLLGGVTNASTTAALTRLKVLTVAEKQVIATEDFPTYNARTGNTLQSLDWDTVQASVQAAYDLQRANIDLQRTYLTATNAVIQAQINAGDTNATLVALPDPLPVKNVQQPKPAWLK